MWIFLLEWSNIIIYPSFPQLSIHEFLNLKHHDVIHHSQFHRFQWFYTSSWVLKFLQWASQLSCALLCFLLLHKVLSQWAVLSFAFNHSFQYDPPLAEITALKLTVPWYLLLPCHCTLLSALCKIRYKIVISSFSTKISQIFIEHVLHQILTLVVGERRGSQNRHLFPHEAYSLARVINISGIDSNKYAFATMITIHYYIYIFVSWLFPAKWM